MSAVTLILSRGDTRYAVELRRLGSDLLGSRLSGRLEIPAVALWWPHTHGEPALYDARLEVGLEASRTPLTVDLGHVGFRTLELDTRGGNFALRVNGARIFCRGACWTPVDPVSLEDSAEALRDSFDRVCSAGMNMLRVGGTMVYESDRFLDLCDTRGVLLWQDFMFANMDYPEDDGTFVASAIAEARQQLARLAARPSLAVLCGNSEGEQQAAMWGAPRESWASPLFHQHLAGLARDDRPDVPYWPSSAHGGSFPHQGNVGTTSYYGVGAYLRPLEDARRAEVRFATECLAFANIPESRSLARIPGGESIRSHHPGWKQRAPRDLGAGWDFDDVRDHYVGRLFGVDPLQLRYGDYERYVTLGRVASGEVMATVFAEWRRKRSTCNGGLVWFWRDLWHGAGWGVLDASGTAKAAYHYLRRVLQPIAVFITDEGGNGLFLHVVNETATPLEATLEVALYRAGEIVVGSATTPVTVPARETLEIAATDIFPGFLDLSYAYRFGPPQQNLVIATLRSATDAVLTQHVHFVSGLALTRESDTGLAATARPHAQAGVEVTIRTRRFAQAVWLEAEGFEADDAYFHMAPGATRTLLMRPATPAPDRAFRGKVHALNALNATKIEGP